MKGLRFVKKHGATILTVLGGAGVVGTGIASTVDHNRYCKLKDNDGFDFKKALKAYIPTMLISGATIGCIFGSNGLNKKELAALGATCMMGVKRFEEYRKRMIERYGEDADREVLTDISKESSVFAQDEIVWWDEYTKKTFKRYEVEILEAEMQLNKRFITNGYVSLNDFREFLGLDPLVPLGYDRGWTYREGYLWIEFEHRLRVDGSKEIVAVFPPITDYMYDYWGGVKLIDDYPREDD